MKTKPLGFWHRFIAVFTPSFISKLMQDKSGDKSWRFWFLSTFFLLAIPTIIISIFAVIFLSYFPSSALNLISAEKTAFELPNGEKYDFKTIFQNFKITLDKNYELQTKNIPDPLILAIDSESDEVVFVNAIDEIDEATTSAVIVIDTKEQSVSLDDVEDFQNVFFLLHDKFIIKDSDEKKTEIVVFKDIFEKEDPEISLPFTLNLNTISEAKDLIIKIFFFFLLFFMGVTYVILAGFRLISALFWALIFWAVGAVAEIKDWNFEKSFMTMLHFSFITMLLFPIGALLGLSMFWNALVILLLLFGANFYEMKRNL